MQTDRSNLDSLLQVVFWIERHLVNRRDVWGAYGPNGAKTAPAVKRRGRELLTRTTILNHLAGRNIIGCHSTSTEDTCRWAAWDFDAHNDDADAALNWAMAQRIANILARAGIEAVIEDSNGTGGFHVWAIFGAPIPAALAWAVAKWGKIEAGADGVEAFPKQPSVRGGFGNYLRLPGRHHKREHWSKFYDTDSETWISGDAGLRFFIATPLNNPERLDDLRPIFPEPPKAAPPVKLNVITPGRHPACIADIMANSIRRSGDRNKGILTLARYSKAAGLSEAVAVATGIMFTKRIPRHLTTSDMTDAEIQGNVSSVVHAVYAGEYPWACWTARTLGAKGNPIACSRYACEFVEYAPEEIGKIPTVEIDDSLTIPTVDPESVGEITCLS